jgi:hypothetical protein
VIAVRYNALIFLALFAGACGGARRGVISPVESRPFSISTIRSSYGIQARLEGSVALRQGWLYVSAPNGAVRTYQVDRQDYWDLRVRAGIASCVNRSVEVTSEGRAARVATLLGLSRDAAYLDTTTRAFKDTLRLDVGVPPGTDLARSWLAFIFEWPFEGVLATYTVHSDIPLDPRADRWTGRQASIEGERCR